MTTDPLSLLGVIAQAIQGLQTAYYAGMSVMIMVIWDYGELTNHMFDRMTPLVFWLSIGPVTTLDREVSPIELFCINGA